MTEEERAGECLEQAGSECLPDGHVLGAAENTMARYRAKE